MSPVVRHTDAGSRLPQFNLVPLLTSCLSVDESLTDLAASASSTVKWG